MSDIEKNIDEFLDIHLGKYEEIVHNHEVIMEKCPDIECPNVDFFFIFPFVERELSHLKSLDYSIFSYDVKKAYSYAKLSKKAYMEIAYNLTPTKSIFLNKFTHFNPEFNEIKTFLEKYTRLKYSSMIRADSTRDKMSALLKIDEADFDDKLYKSLKKVLADALTRMDQAKKEIEIYEKQQEEFKEKYFSIFVDKYDERNDKIIDALEGQMGFFIFYTDFLIWENVSYSFKAKDFFDFIQKEHLKLSTYMIHHLRHQTSLNHKEKTLIEFRKKLIEVIKVIKKHELSNKINKLAS